ncbi:extracellular solute-binding protein [candidate division WWE3 bacterium]|nr:extracellular solute-binding protein [candidate division WWE3 bacterium]
MPKYKIKTLVLLTTLPFLLTACTIQDLPVIGKYLTGANRGPVELTMWGLWEKDYVYNAILNEYKKTVSNVALKYQDMSVLNLNGLVEYKKRVFSRLEQKEWEADIVMVHNSWVPKLIASNYLEPMPTSMITAQKYSELFYPSASYSAVSSDKVYAIPAYYDGLVLVYNKEHFAEINQVVAPTAWEEFRRVAISLTKFSDERKSNLVRAGAAIGYADNIAHFSDIIGLMWAQAGVKFPEGMDSIPAQDAFSFYISMMKDHKVWRSDFPEASTAFVNGQVSMIFIPSWQIIDILAANPNLDIGVAPVPQALPSSPVNWGSFWMYVVPKNSAHKADAWKFLNYLTTDVSEKALFEEGSKVRPFGVPYALTSLSNDLSGDKYLGPLMQSAPTAASSEMAGRSGNRAQEEVVKKAIKLIYESQEPITAETALKAAKEELLNPAPTEETGK